VYIFELFGGFARLRLYASLIWVTLHGRGETSNVGLLDRHYACHYDS